MGYRTRIKYTSLHRRPRCGIAGKRARPFTRLPDLFDRHHTSIRGILAATGGIRPPERRRSRLALTLAEREEISRGIARGLSLRAIAARLGRAPSTISRELQRNGGREVLPGQCRQIRRHGIERSVPSPVNWSSTVHWPALWRRNSDDSGRQSRSPAG